MNQSERKGQTKCHSVLDVKQNFKEKSCNIEFRQYWTETMKQKQKDYCDTKLRQNWKKAVIQRHKDKYCLGFKPNETK